jgi:hypothetical protein
MPFSINFCVREIKACTDNCSGRFVKIGSSFKVSERLKDFKLERNIFLRWLKAVFTTLKNIFSSTGRE